MNDERLLAHYNRIADAPDAVARLRRFILDLAVRGKLVPQDPKDEPASELLNRIASEKARLVKVGEIKRTEPIEYLTAADFGIFIPKGWALTNLQSVCTSVADGDHLPPPKAETGVPFLVIGNVRSQRIDFAGSRFVAAEYYEALDTIRRPQRGDLLYTLVGSYGIPVIVRDNQPFCVQRHIGILRPSAQIDVNYLAHAMESRFAFDQATACATGIAQKTIPLSGLRKLLVVLPPLAEQRRIAAKVDELMGLCDQLNKAWVGREATRDWLAAASLARLNKPDLETFQDDVRFALDALPAMTARSDQIKSLRQLILNLAVRGKLVAQDSTDEPASELLKRIAKEIPDPKTCNETNETLPFGIPTNWAWTRLGLLVGFSDAGWSPKTENHPRTGDKWGVLKVSAVSWDEFRDWENKQVLPGTKPRLQARVNKGDFLISRANTAELIARSVIVEEEPEGLMMSDKIVRLRLSVNINHRYIWIVNNYADFAREHYVQHASGTSPSMKNVSRDVILSLPIPLPPLAEQHRIVTKVNELMSLCDRLEAALTNCDVARGRLLDTLLHEALHPTSGELEAAA